MITIDQLEVRFDAERQRDELVFAELFARYIARYEDRRKQGADDEARANEERSALGGGGGW
jgi:hypothetical protein